MAAHAPPALSVVVPVYNEAKVLEQTFATLLPFLERQEGLADVERADGARASGFEVVCVDDGSTDGSGAILSQQAARDPRIRCEALPRNRGKGAAVRHGVLAARGEMILFMDADLSTPLDETPGFLAALQAGYDVAIGNRRAPGSRIVRHQPWIREQLGRGFTLLTRILLAPGVHDFTCGFKGFRARAAREIFERVTLDGWAFDAEAVLIAQERGFKLVQLPVAWHHEDNTKVRLGAAVARSLGDLGRLWLRRVSGRYRG